jgi:hypothetical protein
MNSRNATNTDSLQAHFWAFLYVPERSEAMVLYGCSEFHRKYAYGHLDAHRVIIDSRIGKGLSQKKRAIHHRPYV